MAFQQSLTSVLRRLFSVEGGSLAHSPIRFSEVHDIGHVLAPFPALRKCNHAQKAEGRARSLRAAPSHLLITEDGGRLRKLHPCLSRARRSLALISGTGFAATSPSEVERTQVGVAGQAHSSVHGAGRHRARSIDYTLVSWRLWVTRWVCVRPVHRHVGTVRLDERSDIGLSLGSAAGSSREPPT